MLKRVMWKSVVTVIAAGACAFDVASAADGALDPSFGDAGLARAGITDGDLQPSGCRPVVQPDSKILICGTRLSNGTSGSDFLVARFNADGSLDTTFGTNGLVTIDFDHGTGGDQADGVALQSDGSIVVAGTTRGSESNSEAFAVARLTSAGALDATFGAGTGQQTIQFVGSMGDDQAYAVAVQPDDKILIAGSTETASGSDVAIVRLTQNGSADAGFGDAGRVTFGFGLPGATAEADNANGVAIDAQGRIVIAGTANESAPNDEIRFGVARLLADGTLDPAFNGNGTTTIAFDPGTGISNAYAFGIVVESDGKLLIPGYANTSPLSMLNMDVAAARLNDDGTPDPTFGDNGRATVGFDLEANGIDAAVAAAEQPDGRVLLVGTAVNSSMQYAISLRLETDGSLDATYGTGGKETYDFGLTTPGTQAFTGITFQGTQIIAGGVIYVPPMNVTPPPLDCMAVRLTNDETTTGGDDAIFAANFD
jgi:uncharacterized delta-60 repeat protein